MPLKVVKEKGRSRLRIIGTHYGTFVRESAGTSSRAEAEAVREKREREIYEEVVLGKKRERTFADAVIGYTSGGGEDRYLPRIVAMIGEEPLSAVNTAKVNEVAAKLYPTAKKSTVNRHVHTPISAVLNWAVDQEWTHPRRIRRPKQPKGRVDWRTPEEMERLIAACAARPEGLPEKVGLAPLDKLVIFYLGTGARASEGLSLQWPDVSPKAERATFWETKAGYSRHADLQRRVRDALPERPDPGEGPVWPWWACYDAVNNRLLRVCARARLPAISCHVFRHTWATWRYAVTRDIDGLMKAGGWKSVDMVMRYVHAGTDDLRDAVLAHGWGFPTSQKASHSMQPAKAA